jgi:Tol biopolymer transport system component
MSKDFRILDWVISPELNRIRHENETVQVEPKIMQVLVELAESPGQVVSRDALLETVWEGTFVSDDVLTRSVVELRKIFGDNSRNSRVIETIPKKGYRLIPPVVIEEIKAVSRERAPSSDIWLRRAAGIAILFVAAIGTLALFDYFRPDANLALSPRVIPLTSSSGNEHGPAVAPDGNQVAFAWMREGEQQEDIYIKSLQSETPLQLTNHPARDMDPTWSPDGQRIAFAREDGEGCDIFLVPALGGPERRLIPCGNRRYPAVNWSPDGEWLVLAAMEEEPDTPLHLELVSISTLERRTLSRAPETYWGDHSATFSPDGNQLAFIRSRIPGIEDVYVLSAEGGEPRRITFDNRDVTGVGWSPDGASLVFSSNRAGTYSMWKSPLAGGEPQWIAGGGMKLKHPAVARQKDVVAYENWVYEINIWQVPTADRSNEAETVVTSTQWDMQPQFSPEGSRLAFISTRSGSTEIWAANADGANPIQLTSLGGPHTSQPRWSPDGEHLVFVSRPEGQADLYTVATSGTPPRRLTSHELDEMAPSWSADGRWIYFGSRRSGRWEIWKVPFEGGEAQQVTTNGGYAAFESPDGASLYFVKSAEPGIWRASPNCREETLVVKGYSPGAWGSWAVSSDGIFYVRNSEAGPEIAFHELESGTTVSVASVPEFMGPGLTLSPDGERILFAQIDRHECDVMVGEGLLLNGYRAR